MGAMKRVWTDQQEALVNGIKRTPITGSWAFKGKVYANVGDADRTLIRLIHRHMSDEWCERLADRVHAKGDVDRFLWEDVQRQGEVRPLTRDELIKEGKRTGVCQVCHRKLTNPKSIAAGIGPVCAGRI